MEPRDYTTARHHIAISLHQDILLHEFITPAHSRSSSVMEICISSRLEHWES